MHDTVAKVQKRIRNEVPRENAGDLFSMRFQGAGLSRALSEPLSAQTELLYVEAFQWLKMVQKMVGGTGGSPIELYYSSQHLHEILEDLIPFLERAEDTLSEREEITHRESSYEREVVPFSRIDSTQAFRSYLNGLESFSMETASAGALVEGDLMKVVYLEGRLDKETPKPTDLYALIAELLLDSRRHLFPILDNGHDFMKALRKAG